MYESKINVFTDVNMYGINWKNKYINRKVQCYCYPNGYVTHCITIRFRVNSLRLYTAFIRHILTNGKNRYIGTLTARHCFVTLIVKEIRHFQHSGTNLSKNITRACIFYRWQHSPFMIILNHDLGFNSVNDSLAKRRFVYTWYGTWSENRPSLWKACLFFERKNRFLLCILK